MRILIIMVVLIICQACHRNYCKPRIPKSRYKMINTLKRDYNYKPYKQIR